MERRFRGCVLACFRLRPAEKHRGRRLSDSVAIAYSDSTSAGVEPGIPHRRGRCGVLTARIFGDGWRRAIHLDRAAGALPGGLTLGGDGTVSGNPTTAGDFSFTIQAADAGGGTAKIDGKIGVAAPLSASLIPACAKYCNVELGCVEVCGAFGQQSGGVAPYSYSLVQGPLPAGTTLSGLSLAGTFVGASGYLKFTVAVTDSLGASTTVAPTFWMYDHIALASGSCYQIFTACSLRLQITGGIPSGSPSVALTGEAPAPTQGCWPASPTPLPPGYTLTVSGGYVNLYIPRPRGGYGAVWTLVLTDHTLCSAGTYCTSPPATAKIGIECT